jgi:hypothetical protein
MTLLQGRSGDSSQYWVYALKTVVGAWLMWPYVKEMRWRLSWEAVLVGIAVFFA